jgi:hypothetical protein
MVLIIQSLTVMEIFEPHSNHWGQKQTVSKDYSTPKINLFLQKFIADPGNYGSIK